MSDDVVTLNFSKVPVTTNEYFGGCPECGRTDGYVNNGPEHWFCCDRHRTRWYVGSNLFSSWREDKSQQEIASLAKVMSFRAVDPVQMPVDMDVLGKLGATPISNADDLLHEITEMMRDEGGAI